VPYWSFLRSNIVTDWPLLCNTIVPDWSLLSSTIVPDWSLLFSTIVLIVLFRDNIVPDMSPKETKNQKSASFSIDVAK
jgi:hypothetical protein